MRMSSGTRCRERETKHMKDGLDVLCEVGWNGGRDVVSCGGGKSSNSH